jgi:hypothetical protein
LICAGPSPFGQTKRAPSGAFFCIAPGGEVGEEKFSVQQRDAVLVHCGSFLMAAQSTSLVDAGKRLRDPV